MQSTIDPLQFRQPSSGVLTGAGSRFVAPQFLLKPDPFSSPALSAASPPETHLPCLPTQSPNVNRNVVPLPGSDSTRMIPPCISMIRCTMARPTPVPS